jgi:hypothetical protein
MLGVSMFEWKMIGLSFCLGALMYGAVRMVAISPWVGIFGVSVCLARIVVENCVLQDEGRKGAMEIKGLEMRLRIMKELLCRLALAVMELEEEYRMSARLMPVIVV